MNMLDYAILASFILMMIFSFIIYKINKNDISSLKNWSIGFLVLSILIFIVLVYLKYQMMTLGGGVLGKLEQVGAI